MSAAERIVDRDVRRADRGLDLAEPRGAARLAARLAPRRRTPPGRRTRSAPVDEHRIVAARSALTSFLPGMSAAVSTATTPGAARTASRSTPSSCPLATGAPPTAMCSRPSGSRMSSMKVALPATCFGAESCRIERRTTRSRSSSARRSGSADIGGLPEAGDAGLRASRRRRSRSAPCAAARAPTSRRYCALARRSSIGLKSSREQRDRLVPVLRVGRDTSRSAPSRRGARASGSPPCRRRRCARPRCACRRARSLNAPITAEMSRVEALGDLVAAEAVLGRNFGTRTSAHELARPAVLLAVVDEVVLQRQRARAGRRAAARASRRARSAPAAGRRSASRSRCCRRRSPAVRICVAGEAAHQLAEIAVDRREIRHRLGHASPSRRS